MAISHFKRRVGINFVVLLFVCVNPKLISAQTVATSPDSPKVLSLKEVLQRTFDRDPRIRSAASDLDATENAVTRSVSGFFPTLDASLSAGTFHDKIPAVGETLPAPNPRDRNNYEGQLMLRQPLFSGFKDYSASMAARRDRESKEMALSLAKAKIMEEVVVRYFELQALSRELRAEEEVSSFRQRQFSEVKNRIAAGRATELERLQAEYAVESQVPLIQRLKTEISTGLVELLQNMGENVGNHITLADSLDGASAKLSEAKLPDFAKAQEMAKTSNFELLLAQREIERDEFLSGASFAKNLPSLDFELFANTKASKRVDVATTDTIGYAGQVKLSVPLFSGLSSVWERREAASRKMSLEEKKASKWNQVTTDLYRKYREWELAGAQEKAEAVNLKLTAQKIRAAESSYRNGRATMTDLLDSYSQDLAARKNLAKAQLDKLRSFFAIKRLIGENIDIESKESL